MLAKIIAWLVIALLGYLEHKAKQPKTAVTAVRDNVLLRRIHDRVRSYENSIRTGGDSD